jgi:NAD(P)-dependent dehydrogenase (short-subunit alcohol dehydrogenase family)
MQRLAGKVAFITGAGTGIGRATAILFAREGAKVAIVEIDAPAGEETAHLAGSEAIAIHADVTDPDSLQSAIRATVDKFGRLDVLHNNAGGSTARDDTAVDAPLDEFWRAIKLDLYGTFLGCKFGIPELIRAGGGSVINMSSNVALMGVPGRDCYTAAKGGIAAITRSLAVAYAPRKVRVNAIAPSATMTERVKKLVAGNAALTRLADSHLLGLIEPDDIALTALYLASDESRMVTGQVLPVDSGVTIS